ncbi:unnamed protein product [Schistosoma mattheei]|uniref:Uncharacterized protein n=1 Tax=Schistosoma mattheei TaxID=31246 RepID=A0A183PRE3_9TREM|nr:unnamed protein product [Schistosoma mattheei]
MAVRVITDLQHITEIMQSVIQNNSDPHYVPIKGESRIQSIDNSTELTTLNYLESNNKIHSTSLPNSIKTLFQFDANPIKTSRYSIKKQIKTNKIIYFNPPHNLWLPSANIPSSNYQRKVIWTFNSNSDNILKYICTYGRKRSTSNSDACLQDIDDDNGHHSHKEHASCNSPSPPMYASLQINLFQTTEV